MASIRKRWHQRLSKAQRRERRRRQTCRTRAVRRQLRRGQARLPRPARAVVETLSRGAGAVVAWLGKPDVTFSDALTTVRRWLGVDWIFAIPGHGRAFSKLRRPFQQILLAGLTPAP